MSRLFLTHLFLIMALTNGAYAITILSESYHVSGWGQGTYDDTNTVPPVSGSTDLASSTAGFFHVYAAANKSGEEYGRGFASSIYEIMPLKNRLEIKLLSSHYYGGYSGFELKDTTENLLIGSFYWTDRDPFFVNNLRLSYYQVNPEHHYNFRLFADSDAYLNGDSCGQDLKAYLDDVPEPATITLLGLGVLALRKKRRTQS